MNLRERVAQAICDTTCFGQNFPWSTLNEREREPWLEAADAAIAVIEADRT